MFTLTIIAVVIAGGIAALVVRKWPGILAGIAGFAVAFIAGWLTATLIGFAWASEVGNGAFKGRIIGTMFWNAAVGAGLGCWLGKLWRPTAPPSNTKP